MYEILVCFKMKKWVGIYRHFWRGKLVFLEGWPAASGRLGSAAKDGRPRWRKEVGKVGPPHGDIIKGVTPVTSSPASSPVKRPVNGSVWPWVAAMGRRRKRKL